MTERPTARYISECSKRPSSKAAASEGARHTFRYVEPLSDARTPLEDFFSILLEGLTARDMFPSLRALILVEVDAVSHTARVAG